MLNRIKTNQHSSVKPKTSAVATTTKPSCSHQKQSQDPKHSVPKTRRRRHKKIAEDPRCVKEAGREKMNGRQNERERPMLKTGGDIGEATQLRGPFYHYRRQVRCCCCCYYCCSCCCVRLKLCHRSSRRFNVSSSQHVIIHK